MKTNEELEKEIEELRKEIVELRASKPSTGYPYPVYVPIYQPAAPLYPQYPGIQPTWICPGPTC